ncbi:MAG: PRC-barrel domain-containing protein [Propionibacteriaceae bacterium]|nr:PRC-barrel domain-containing protein [Propionibacteriaceae bacterium]
MNNKVLKGLAAVSIADAEKIGTVARSYFDPEKMVIVGFEIEPVPGGTKSATPSLVDVAAVHSLGPDALMLGDKAIEGKQTGDRFNYLIDVDTLVKHKVVTEDGTFVGQVASVEFDEKTFRLTDLEASPGFFKTNKHIALRQITKIGNDLIVVADSVRTDTSNSGAEAHRFSRVVESDDPAVR